MCVFFFFRERIKHSAVLAVVAVKAKVRAIRVAVRNCEKGQTQRCFLVSCLASARGPRRRSPDVERVRQRVAERKRVKEGAVAGVRCAFLWVGEQEGLCAFQKENIVVRLSVGFHQRTRAHGAVC